ncbi:hypothetical protein FIBSPDRAFT_714409, partial [Athelia psychrophila]
CPEAARYGSLQVSPSTVAAGDSVNIYTNLTCPLSPQYEIVPKYLDYYIEVLTNNNGHELPILLARREFDTSLTFDNFTTTIPDGNYFAGAAYSVYVDITYPVNGTTGAPYYQVAGTYGSINIT